MYVLIQFYFFILMGRWKKQIDQNAEDFVCAFRDRRMLDIFWNYNPDLPIQPHSLCFKSIPLSSSHNLSVSLSLSHTYTRTPAQSFTMQADWPYSAQGCECWPPTPEHKQESSYKDGLSKGCLWHRMPNKSTVNRQRTHGSTGLSSPQWAVAADCTDTS